MQQQDDRRRRVLAEAANHFLRNGFQRTRIDQIAASARVSKTVLYEEFRGKDDLFAHVVRAELEGLPPSRVVSGDDLSATLEQFALDGLGRFYTSRFFGIYRANFVARRQFPALAAAVHEVLRARSHELADYLDACRMRGQLAFEGNALDLANSFGSMMQFGARPLLGFKVPPARARRTYVAFLTHVFLHGCRNLCVQPPPGDAISPPQVEIAVHAATMRLRPERFSALCEAALQEFLAAGFEGSSIEPMITASGVSRATIYRLFGNKDGLFAFVLGREIERAAAGEIEAPGGSEAETRLAGLARSTLERHLTPRSLALHRLMIEEAVAFPHLARRFYEAQVQPVVRSFSDALVVDGMQPPSTLLAQLFHTLATQAVRFIAAEREPLPELRRKLASEAARIIWRGVAP